MFTFPLHLNSSVGVRFARSFVFCVMFRSSLFVSFFSLFFVGHYIVCVLRCMAYGIFIFSIILRIMFKNITFFIIELFPRNM